MRISPHLEIWLAAVVRGGCHDQIKQRQHTKHKALGLCVRHSATLLLQVGDRVAEALLAVQRFSSLWWFVWRILLLCETWEVGGHSTGWSVRSIISAMWLQADPGAKPLWDRFCKSRVTAWDAQLFSTHLFSTSQILCWVLCGTQKF